MNMELVLVPDSLVLHAIMHIPSTHLFRWQYSPVVCPFQNIDAFKYAYRTVYKCRYYVKDVIHVCKLLEPTSQGSCRCQVAIRAQGSPCHWKCHRSYGASSFIVRNCFGKPSLLDTILGGIKDDRWHNMHKNVGCFCYGFFVTHKLGNTQQWYIIKHVQVKQKRHLKFV